MSDEINSFKKRIEKLNERLTIAIKNIAKLSGELEKKNNQHTSEVSKIQSNLHNKEEELKRLRSELITCQTEKDKIQKELSKQIEDLKDNPKLSKEIIKERIVEVLVETRNDLNIVSNHLVQG